MDDDEAQFFSRAKRKHESSTLSESRRSPQIIDSSSESDSDASLPSKRNKGKLRPSSARPEASTNLNREKSDAKTTRPSQKEVQVISDTDSDPADDNTRNISTAANSRTQTIGTKTRSRRKSGSLTPPPQISPGRRIAGSQIMQNVMAPLLSNLHSLDDTHEAIQADEAELLFEAQMRQHALENGTSASNLVEESSSRTTASVQSPSRTRGNAAPKPIPKAVLEVVIAGVYVDSTASKEIIHDIELWEKPRLFKIRLNTKISIAKIAFCKDAGMYQLVNGRKVVTPEDEVRHSEIVLVYRDVRIFDYMTPFALGIAEGEQPYFEAHTKAGWHLLGENPDLRKMRQIQLENVDAEEGPSVTSASEEQDSNVDFFRLILRASDGKELKVRSRPSTKITALISGFRRVHAIPETCEISLHFEGDKLEGTLADTDLEEDDIVDVKVK